MFGGSTSDCLARTWTVNPSGTGDAPSIQAAIDSAQVGDSVFLEAGTYYESIDFRGKSLPVSGSGRFNTIIDASTSDGPCATFMSGETNAAVLEHMTLTGGKGHWYGTNTRMGGGVIIDGAEPVLRDLLIAGNGISAGAELIFGGGVQVFGKRVEVHPVIEYCDISNNKAAGDGGGLGFQGVVMPTIRHCSIHDNEAQFDGGGVWCNTSLGAVIDDNIVINNIAGDHGGGIYVSPNNLYLPLVEIADNLVANNVAYGNDSSDLTGGGMMFYGLNANIHHNTIVGNSGRTAGGVTMQMGGRWKLDYNIFANTVNGFGIACDNSTNPEFNHNIAWNNPGGVYCPGWANGTDNLEVDPLFCEPSDNNFTVQETSPALTRFSSYAGYDPTPGCKGKYIYSTWGAIKARHY